MDKNRQMFNCRFDEMEALSMSLGEDILFTPIYTWSGKSKAKRLTSELAYRNRLTSSANFSNSVSFDDNYGLRSFSNRSISVFMWFPILLPCVVLW